MITQTELKTFIPAIVAPCILFYESVSGNHISETNSLAMTNGIIIGAGFIVSLWGAWKNHQKTKPPENTTSSQKEVYIRPEVVTPSINPSTPIVTQEDLNKHISK